MELKLLQIFILSLVFFLNIWTISSERILVLTPIGTKSHKHVFEPLIRELAKRNHHITAISNVKSDFSEFGSNVTEIVPYDVSKLLSNFPDPLDRRRMGFFSSFWDFDFIFSACDSIYENKEFQRLMSQEYDLIIMNGFMNYCFSGYLYTKNVPFIFLVSMPAPNTILRRLGGWQPTSFCPNSFLPMSAEMNFIERIINTIFDWMFILVGDLTNTPKFEAVYRKYLGNDIPGLADIESNISLVLMNHMDSFPSPRPSMPDVISVGGMHCRPAKPLPKELDEFLSGAEHGFIFFSFGSVIQSKALPESIKKNFVNVFSRLKQRVLWKWDEEFMDDLPSNVKLQKWLPQQDILGHSNIKLFITHGGLLSTQETIYHGVPLVGIPIFIDQDINMNQAEAAGFALTLEILEITEEKLENIIHRVLDEPQFRDKAKYLSRAFRDSMHSPAEKGAFMVEYILKHDGAKHLRSTARKLNWFQYHSLDVIGFLLLVLLITLTVIYIIIRTIFAIIVKLFFKSATQNQTGGKKKTN